MFYLGLLTYLLDKLLLES